MIYERLILMRDQCVSRMHAGRRKLAVRVVNIFGNDTVTTVNVNVGGKK